MTLRDARAAGAGEDKRARDIYGLDRPVWERYARFWGRLVHTGPRVIDPKKDREHRSCGAVALGVHVDLGFSFHWRKPVVDLLAAKMPRSLQLGFAAFVVQAVLGIGLGLFAASRRGSRWDEATLGVTALGWSAPVFLVGLLLQYVLAYRLRVLPYDGFGRTPEEQLRSVVLPAITLGARHRAVRAAHARRGGHGARADFQRTARAKGASRARVLFVHALRAAAVPIVTIAALDLGTMVGGAIVTEKMFRWPGVG
ncbi:MAG: ABC transporter permease [Polyangiaceae bacterium]